MSGSFSTASSASYMTSSAFFVRKKSPCLVVGGSLAEFPHHHHCHQSGHPCQEAGGRRPRSAEVLGLSNPPLRQFISMRPDVLENNEYHVKIVNNCSYMYVHRIFSYYMYI
jgi:hypothetical protein